MMATKIKRSKLMTESIKTKETGNVLIYIIPHKIQNRRLEILRKSCKEKNLSLTNCFCSDVTHIVTEHETREQVLKALPSEAGEQFDRVSIVNTSWLSQCIKSGHVIDIQPDHLVRSAQNMQKESTNSTPTPFFPEYACQRIALLRHQNEKFTNALEALEEFANLRDDELNYSRALAFSRASATLRSYPEPVTSIAEIAKLPDIGGHCRKVIEDILDTGFSQEVDAVLSDNWYKTMKLFTGVFGVGPATAKKWIKMGLSTIDEVINSKETHTKDDSRLAVGLAFFDDLSMPVVRSEAESVLQLVRSEAASLVPGTTVELGGGFRRGKDTGHDIDILISHPDEGREQGILPDLVLRLDRLGVVVYGRRELSTADDAVTSENKGVYLRSTLDHFEKWLGVIKVDKSVYKPSKSETCASRTALPRADVNENVSDKAGDVRNVSATNDCTDGTNEPLSVEEGSSCCTKLPDVMCVLKSNGSALTDFLKLSRTTRSWTARRVDLIVIPRSQYYYGLVGWTGSRHFNRSMRLYAQRVYNKRLTSHGLFDMTTNESIPADSELQVFTHLQLPYREPHQRNC